jgi:hypothetical protein
MPLRQTIGYAIDICGCFTKSTFFCVAYRPNYHQPSPTFGPLAAWDTRDRPFAARDDPEVCGLRTFYRLRICPAFGPLFAWDLRDRSFAARGDPQTYRLDGCWAPP